VVTKRQPTPEEKRALLFAWKICKHVKSNAILYARDGKTVGVGAGQMSRVDAAKVGAIKAVLPLKGRWSVRRVFSFPGRKSKRSRAWDQPRSYSPVVQCATRGD